MCVCVCVLCRGEGRSGDQSFCREIRWNSSETRAFSCSLTVRSHHGLCRRPLLVASVEVRKVTMPLAATFKEHYSLLTTGTRGDENVRAFNKAMDLESNLCDAVKAFNNANGMGQDRKVKSSTDSRTLISDWAIPHLLAISTTLRRYRTSDSTL